MHEAKKQKVFQAKIEMIPQITEYISEHAEKAQLHLKQITFLQVAIDEVVSNICRYAYQMPPGEILVQIESVAGKFIIDFIDEGLLFDPLTAEEPDITANLDERAAGGLGIFLVRRVIDEVHYKREGNKNILTLVLYIPVIASSH